MTEITIAILRHYEDALEFIQSDEHQERVIERYLTDNDMNTGLCNYINRRHKDYEDELVKFLKLTNFVYLWRIPQDNWKLANICLYDRVNYLKQFV